MVIIMRKKSKLHIGIARIITTLLVISSFFPAVWQGEAAYAEETYHISASIVQKENEVIVSVFLTGNNPQLDGLQFNLAYDQTAFALKTVEDKHLIGQNTQFSPTKETNPYFCSWYVGTDEKPAVADGEIASFVFQVKDDEDEAAYSFAIKDIQAFYNTIEVVDGKNKAIEKKITLSTVRSEISIKKVTESLYTYEEAQTLLAQEAERVQAAILTVKQNALEAYDAQARGYSIEAAEIVYQTLYEEAAAALKKSLSLQQEKLEEDEEYNQSIGQGGQKKHDISQMLKDIREKSKDESYFSENASDDALQSAENSLTESLDGKRIIPVIAGENLVSYFSAAAQNETLYFSLTIPEEGVYGFDTIYNSEDEHYESEDKVRLEDIYKKVGDRYKKLESDIMGTGNYIDELYTVRIEVSTYENQRWNNFFSEGTCYVFAITLADGFKPQQLKLMSYDYAKCKIKAGDGGALINMPHRTGESTLEDEFSITDYVSAGAVFGLAHDGYVFDGLYNGDVKLDTWRAADEGKYYCYIFRNAKNEVVAPKDFWMFGSDVYFENQNGKQIAEFTSSQLKDADLEGIAAEYLPERDVYWVTLENLMKKIGGTKCMIKNQARNEYFDLHSSGIEKRKYNVITAKFRPMLYGDADGNGKVDFADVLLLKRYLAGWDKYGEANNIAVDLDGDGEVTPADLMILERHIAGWKAYKELPKIS